MNKARRLQKWFNRYGLTKDEKKLTEGIRYGRNPIWYILLKVVGRAYNKGYKDGINKGRALLFKEFYKDVPDAVIRILREGEK